MTDLNKKEPALSSNAEAKKPAETKKPVEASKTIEPTQKVESAQNNTAAKKADSAQKAETKSPLKAEFLNKKPLFIDVAELEQRGFVTTQDKRCLINEEYRSIKRKLLNNAFGALSTTIKNGNLIVVSSARPNEGKTFTAINLALSIALEQDKTVLLVDADVLKPSLNSELEIETPVGLTEYLLNDVSDVSDVIYSTNIERLRIIPAGLPHHLSSELLASERMVTLAEEFAKRYADRIVIFDAPPLLGVNETTILAELSGQAVVVVEDEISKVSEVKQAVDLLPKDMAVGFVFNKNTNHKSQGYGYYYGYGYGQ